MKTKRLFYFFIILVLLSVVSCQFDVQIKEMSLARLNIAEAEKFNAEKYAPGELKKAKEYLFKCHIDVRKKDKGKLKDDSENALKFSIDAVNKSLPPLSKDTLEEAKKLYNEISNSYDEKYSSDELFGPALNIKKAEKLHTEKKYRESYYKSIESIELIKAASGKIREKIKEIAGNKITEAENLYKNARENEASSYFEKDINIASEHIAESRSLYDKDSLTGSIASSGKAITLLNSLKESMEKKAEEIRIKKAEEEKKGKEKKEKEEYEVDDKVSSRSYSVKRGDCMWKIAQKVYKNAKLWPLIYAANRNRIKDPDLIFPAQKFTIPALKKKEDPGKYSEDSDVPEDKENETVDDNNVDDNSKNAPGSKDKEDIKEEKNEDIKDDSADEE